MYLKLPSLALLIALPFIAGCNKKEVAVSFETGPGQSGVFTFNSADIEKVSKKYPKRFPEKSQLSKLIAQKAENGKAFILISEYKRPTLIRSLIEEKAHYKVVCKKCNKEIPTSEISVEQFNRNGASVSYKDNHGHTLLHVVLFKI